jgi:transcriptional regulator with XRE-family HTH domain
MTKFASKYFGQNLRIQCEKFGSIAEVCRGTSLNRQQFNKYLRGENLPNVRTRRRLCEFFNVPEEEMFAPPEGPRPEAKDGFYASDGNLKYSPEALKGLEEFARTFLQRNSQLPKCNLADGYYHCYFPLQNQRNFLVRAALKISTSNGLTSFTRHTYFRSAEFSSKFIARGRHRGIVIQAEGEIYLLGMNSFEPFHLSLIAIPNGAGPIRIGLGLTRGISQSMTCRIGFEFVGTGFAHAKSLAKKIGVVHTNDKSVHPSIKAAFSPQDEYFPGQLDLPAFEKIIANFQALEQLKNLAPQTVGL